MTTTNQPTKALLLATALVLFGVAIAGTVAGQAPDATDAGADCAVPTLDDKCEQWVATKDGGCNGTCPAVFSPDSQHVYVATSGGDADLAVDALDADTGERVWSGSNDEDAGGPMGNVEAIDVSQDGEYVALFGTTTYTDDSGILTVVFDTDTGVQLWSSVHEPPAGDSAEAGDIGPNGERVFVTGESATVAYDLKTGAEVWSVDTESETWGWSGGAWDVLAGPEGENVYVTIEETPHQAIAYNATTGEPQWTADVDDTTPEFIYSNSISPDGRTLLFAGGDRWTSGYAAALDTNDGEFLWRADLDVLTGSPWAGSYSSAVSPDSQTAYIQGMDHTQGDTSGGEGYVLAFDTRTGNHRWTHTEPGQYASGLDTLAVSPDDSSVYASFTSNMLPGQQGSYLIRSDLTTLSLDADTGQKEWRATYNGDNVLLGGHWPSGVQASPDGSHVYVATQMGLHFSGIVLGQEAPIGMAYQTGSPDLDPGIPGDVAPAETSSNPEGSPEATPSNRDLAGSLLDGFDRASPAGPDQALEAARIVMDHRETTLSDPEAGIVPMLDRQQANLDLSEQILTVAEGPDRPSWENAGDIAELGILDRIHMAEDGALGGETSVHQLEQARSNLDAARHLLDSLDTEHPTSLEGSITLAKETTRHQADALDLDWTTPASGPIHPSPSQAARTLADRFDGAPVLSEDVDRLDQLPEPTRTALTNLLDAFLRYEAATTQAYAQADLSSFDEAPPTTAEHLDLPDQEGTLPLSAETAADPQEQHALKAGTDDPPDPLEALEEAGVDLSSVLPARNALMEAMLLFSQALDENALAGTSNTDPIQLDAPPALAIDLTDTDNAYTEDYALLIDAGGNDRYANNAGGSNVQGGHEGDCRGNPTQAAALFDLGSGDDDYTTPGRGCGVRGGGYLGAGLLLDEGGNDTFNRYETGSNPQTTSFTDASNSQRGQVETTSAAPGGNHEATDRYIVGLEDAPDEDPGDRFHDAPIVKTSPSLRFLVVEPDDPGAFLEQAREDPAVRYVEEDLPVQLQHEPGDPLYQDQYGPQQVNAPEAWNTSLGDASRSVCIVDTGVDYTHPDLESPRWLGGTDIAEGDSNPFDVYGHGTHVAGIAAATVDNDEGIAGVGNVGLQAAKVFSDSGWAYPSDIALGIEWCADNDGDVISLSLAHDDVAAVHDAVEYAWDAGSLIVASAGNEACFECLMYPAAYDEAIAVTCTDRQKSLCGLSSYGPGSELAAPGHAVLSTESKARGGGYDERSGTSMSAPHVSGVAALVWSQVSDLSNDELRQLLRDSAEDLGASGCDEMFGHGLVDAGATLEAALDGDRPALGGASDCLSSGYFGTNGGALGGVGLLVAAGEGDDTFTAGGLGANGGAVEGIGGLIRSAGSNTYEAVGLGTNGGGVSGSGLLVDTSKEETTYLARERGTNGGASDEGLGFLLDAGGSNSYQAAHLGTNGGSYGGGVGLVFDAGHKDTTYRAAEGGTNGGGSWYQSVGLLIDAGGNDTYEATLFGTNGGATYRSAGFLVDADGHDAYTATQLGANGGSFGFSAGFLADTGGHDAYTGTQKGVNGGGFGATSGFLLDTAGDNTYKAGRVATNGGTASSILYYGGTGFLFDAGPGDTTYDATEIGTNGGAHSLETVGLLLDAGGSNTYTATKLGTNGGGAGIAYGALIDAGTGTSTFEATSEGTNGGGTFSGYGLLANAGGDNTYKATDRGTNGCAFASSSGFLLDARGDDSYHGTSYGTNGGALSESSGFLLDAAGDDAYKADECGTNGGADAECLPPLAVANPSTHALLLDGEGTDAYEDALSECTDCTHAPKGGVGVQVDASGESLWEAIQG